MTDRRALALAADGRTQDEPDLAVVRGERELRGLVGRHPHSHVLRVVAACRLAAGVRRLEDQDVLDQRAQLRAAAAAGRVRGVEAREDVHRVAGADLADHAVRRVQWHGDRALVATELAAKRIGVRGEVRRGDLLARIDVARRDLAVERGGARQRSGLEVVLLDRRGLEQPAAHHDSTRGSLGDQPVGDER